MVGQGDQRRQNRLDFAPPKLDDAQRLCPAGDAVLPGDIVQGQLAGAVLST